MSTSSEIKQRASALAEKTDVNSITPKEVGGIMFDLASHSENVLRNSGTLGIRKVYKSVAAMEADATEPVDLWGEPIKKGNLVVIYDGTDNGVDNNKIYAFMKPGWELATKLDAAYATKSEMDAKLSELASEVGAKIDVIDAKGVAEAVIDSENRILEARDIRGKKTVYTDVEVKGEFKNKNTPSKEELNSFNEWMDSSQNAEVLVDYSSKVLEKRDKKGKKTVYTDVEVKGKLSSNGKVLIEEEIANSLSTDYSNKWLDVTTDNGGKVIEGINTKGEKYINKLYSNESMILQNPYFGKVLTYIGDSLSYGSKWAKYIKKCLGMVVNGTDIGGTSISGSANTCYWQNNRVNQLDLKASVVVIQGGTNDIGAITESGKCDKSNYNTNTFCGAFNVLLSKLYYKYLKLSKGYYDAVDYSGVTQVEIAHKSLPIYVILPPKMLYNGDEFNYDEHLSGLQKRRNDLIELCNYWGIDYVDGYNIGYNYMTNESSDTVHGAMEFFDRLSSKIVHKMIENSFDSSFLEATYSTYGITVDNKTSIVVKVQNQGRAYSTVRVLFTSLPNEVVITDSDNNNIPFSWIDRTNNFSLSFEMPENSVKISINN